MASEVYDVLNKSWKSTCRILLGEEIGELKDYEGWLKDAYKGGITQKSHLSGKEVVLASIGGSRNYCKNARFVSADELKENAIKPLTINEIKDVDSIVEAVAEKWEYTGNIILGNSQFVDKSSLITNSSYVYDSYDVSDSSYIAYSTMARKQSKYCFGAIGLLNEFLIRGANMNVKRGLETLFNVNSSDLYFAYNCNDSSDLMFCFNLKSKRNYIGNLQLPTGKYSELKKKLLAEMREELKREKKLPSLLDLCKNEKPEHVAAIKKTEEKFDMAPIEKAFSATAKVIFKKELGSIKDYEKYLSRYIKPIKELISPAGIKVYQPNEPYRPYPEKRIVSLEEAYEFAKTPLNEAEISGFRQIKENLWKNAFFVGQFREGNFYNYERAYFVINSMNIYGVNDATNAENCAIDNMALNSKYAFGSSRILESQFSINCHNSLRLGRCFELDSCTNCSDTYFAHNCEGLIDAMFCWNVKAKHCAIGNRELPTEQYRKIRDGLVEQMADEILRTKELKWDIYNIGCAKA
ncbi:MAG: hypothetical protein V1492_06210 [Candidatus Micrarchaeota archaeon]